jgi:DNA polymerase-3 subunit delta
MAYTREMVQTFTGKNSFALAEALKQIIADYDKEVGSFGIERFDASETEVDTLLQAVQSLPFLSPKKLIVIHSIQSNAALMERIEEFVGRVADGVEVVLVDSTLDKRKSSYKQLQKLTTVQDFRETDARNLATWIVAYTKEQGGSCSLRDAQYLVDRVGGNQQQLAREIEKMVTYSAQIDKQVIDLLTDQSAQSSIFMLLETVFSGNTQRAIELYREQRSLQLDPHYILAMFVWQLQTLAQAVFSDQKTESALVEAGQSPYTARKSLQLARMISKERMKKMIVSLSELDVQIKSSADPDAALELYILRV